uniref:Uncharacterized protein n=1 Tax=Anguilla anguilla TaxID=7936 RepID=A0A0E9PIR9_ANGAN
MCSIRLQKIGMRNCSNNAILLSVIFILTVMIGYTFDHHVINSFFLSQILESLSLMPKRTNFLGLIVSFCITEEDN